MIFRQSPGPCKAASRFSNMFLPLVSIVVWQTAKSDIAISASQAIEGTVITAAAGVFRIQRQPFLEPRLGVRLDRVVSQSFPDVPTAKQAGLDYEVSNWAGMLAPKGTPTNIIDKLANNLDAALEEPTVKNRLADLGVSSQKGGSVLPQNSPALSNLRFLVGPPSSRLRTQTANRPVVRNAPQALEENANRHISRTICLGNSLPSAPLRSHNVLLTCDNRTAGVRRSYARTRGRWLRGRAMALEIHEPEVEMGGRQVIRVGNKDRPMSWITFHFESEADAMAAHEQLSSALSKAVKVEWP